MVFYLWEYKLDLIAPVRTPQGLWGTSELAISINGNMGRWANLLIELGIKVYSGEQFDISLKETFKNIFGNKGDFGSFSREHRNTDPP